MKKWMTHWLVLLVKQELEFGVSSKNKAPSIASELQFWFFFFFDMMSLLTGLLPSLWFTMVEGEEVPVESNN